MPYSESTFLAGKGNGGAYAELVRMQRSDFLKDTVKEKSPWLDDHIRNDTPGITTRHSRYIIHIHHARNDVWTFLATWAIMFNLPLMSEIVYYC